MALSTLPVDIAPIQGISRSDSTPSYGSVKKECLNGVPKAIGTYLEDNKPLVREIIKTEITRLALTFAAIEDDFAKITPEIRRLDDSQILAPRLEEWQELHHTYTSLTNHSRRAALKIKDSITDLIEIILPLLKNHESEDEEEAIDALTECILPALKSSSVKSAADELTGKILPCLTNSKSNAEEVLKAIKGLNKLRPALKHSADAAKALKDDILPALRALLSAKDLKEAIEDRLAAMEELQDETEKVKTGFLRLKQGIFNFRTELERDVNNDEEELLAGIAEVKKRIAQLENDLQTTTEFFTKCGDMLQSARDKDNVNTFCTAMATAGYLGTIQGTAGLAAIAPEVGIEMLIAGLHAISSTDLANKVKEHAIQHDTNFTELCELRASYSCDSIREKQLQDACEMLDKHRPQFDRICDRMLALYGIWNMLWADSETLLGKIKTMNTTNSRVVKDFAEKGIKPVYKALHRALDDFVNAYDEISATREELEDKGEN